MSEFSELRSTPQTTLYDPVLLAAGVDRFGREGFWLLLSIQHYGWRAHVDMASLVVFAADELDLGTHHREHRAMAAFEELFLLLDQIWRTVSGVRSHRDGGDFLIGYTRHGADTAAEFAALEALGQTDWRGILSIPADDEIDALLTDHFLDVTSDEARASAAGIVDTTMTNMREIGELFLRADLTGGVRGRSLRDVNNAYRHGSRVVYEDAAPSVVPWRAANPSAAQGILIAAGDIEDMSREGTVNVLLENPDEHGHARFSAVPTSDDALNSLVDGMKHLSVLLWRIVTSFIVAELQDEPPLSATMPIGWAELDHRFRNEERELSA